MAQWEEFEARVSRVQRLAAELTGNRAEEVQLVFRPVDGGIWTATVAVKPRRTPLRWVHCSARNAAFAVAQLEDLVRALRA